MTDYERMKGLLDKQTEYMRTMQTSEKVSREELLTAKYKAMYATVSAKMKKHHNQGNREIESLSNVVFK